LPSSAPLVFICGLVVGGMTPLVTGRINLNSAETGGEGGEFRE
jgi:hypothetical protein